MPKFEIDASCYRLATHDDFNVGYRWGASFERIVCVPGGWVVRETWKGVALCFIPFPEKYVLVEAAEEKGK